MSNLTLLEKPNVQQQAISSPSLDNGSGFEHIGATMRRMFENLARHGDMLYGEEPTPHHTSRFKKAKEGKANR
ncbi:MAG: hypothetical protein R3B74_11970 [Nitrospirales bacterium]|nr:hypothetical protein [Nitrospirales bacterium]